MGLEFCSWLQASCFMAFWKDRLKKFKFHLGLIAVHNRWSNFKVFGNWSCDEIGRWKYILSGGIEMSLIFSELSCCFINFLINFVMWWEICLDVAYIICVLFLLKYIIWSFWIYILKWRKHIKIEVCTINFHFVWSVGKVKQHFGFLQFERVTDAVVVVWFLVFHSDLESIFYTFCRIIITIFKNSDFF